MGLSGRLNTAFVERVNLTLRQSVAALACRRDSALMYCNPKAENNSAEAWKEVREMARDPVCGMEVDEQQAAATAEYQGTIYYFCAPSCKKAFEKEPEKYIPNAAQMGADEGSV